MKTQLTTVDHSRRREFAGAKLRGVKWISLCIPMSIFAVILATTAAEEKVTPSQPYVFKSQEEAEKARKQRELQTQTNILERMKGRGASHEEIVGVREGFLLQNTGVTIRTWDDWTNHYRPEILNPPVQFDARQPQPMDFSNPVVAFRSFEHAVFAGNATTLLAHADGSGRAWLKNYLHVEENIPRSTYEIFTNMSVLTILLTATHAFDGTNYTLVLSRCQEHTRPKSGRVSFIVHFFRLEGGSYVFTGDMSIFGPFGSVRAVAGASDGNLQVYPRFHENMTKSAFPPHFYTIED